MKMVPFCRSSEYTVKTDEEPPSQSHPGSVLFNFYGTFHWADAAKSEDIHPSFHVNAVRYGEDVLVSNESRFIRECSSEATFCNKPTKEILFCPSQDTKTYGEIASSSISLRSSRDDEANNMCSMSLSREGRLYPLTDSYLRLHVDHMYATQQQYMAPGVHLKRKDTTERSIMTPLQQLLSREHVPKFRDGQP